MKLLLAIEDSKFSEAAAHAVIAQHTPQTTEVKVLNVVGLVAGACSSNSSKMVIKNNRQINIRGGFFGSCSRSTIGAGRWTRAEVYGDER